MLQFNSAILAAAGLFTGTYAPYQAIHIEPMNPGVLVAASDQGRVSAIGFDHRGQGDESFDLLPSKELLAACSGIKSAERDIRIEGNAAVVTTYRKVAANEAKEFPIHRAMTPFPPLAEALAACVERWGATPTLSATAGRYSSAMLERAIKAASHLNDSIVISAFDGGPLRLQGDKLELCILLMPQTAEPLPGIPEWILKFAGSTACHVAHDG